MINFGLRCVLQQNAINRGCEVSHIYKVVDVVEYRRLNPSLPPVAD